MSRSSQLAVAALALIGLLGPGPGMPGRSANAAVQGKVDAKYQIPVPKTQRKIGQDEEKEFEDGKLKLKVLKVERTSIEISANGGAARPVPASTLTLVPIDEQTICTVAFLGKSGAKAIVAARCDPATDEARAAAEAQHAAEGTKAQTPLEVVTAAAKGTLKNPFADDPAAIEEGHQLFLANSCNGCHGGNGGGGMGPPLSNAVWVYGSEDDTLFRLVTKGSDELQADGYSRKGRESVVGPMPPFGEIIENSDHLWKIIAFVRSIYKGDMARKNW